MPGRALREPRSHGARGPLALSLVLLAGLLLAPGAQAAITSHGATSYSSSSTTRVVLAVPTGALPGDVLIASLGVSWTTVAPAGWTLVTRAGDLSVYSHVLASGETSFAWSLGSAAPATGFLAAFGGVDPARPVDVANSLSITKKGHTFSTPSITTSGFQEMLVASFTGSRADGKKVTWSTPSGMTELGDTYAGSRSGAVDYAVQSSAGSTGSKKANTSTDVESAATSLVALRPAPTMQPPPPAGAVPLVIDTDIWSDADDVGALATAFGLQIRGEARVIAVGVNTRTSRPAVATASWKCVAAVTNFYNSFSVPIGASMPDNGTAVNDPDFVGPCSKLAPPSTPVPDTAVNVFRRALASQADGSVVIASAGYYGNLAALLASPGDSISPLNGRDLVARKVRMLVAMGGGYPSRSGENNFIGDPSSAQAVASGWPTKVVWSGYEVGDLVHTGQTISSVHPTSSPVRVSYEAFVRPGNWIYSYDLTAVYHAVRPGDSQLTEIGPGQNTVDSLGGNRFTTGSGNQYYLKLGSASALDSSIEALLDTLPSGSPPPPPSDTTPPAISSVAASGSTVSWTTDEPATSQVEYGTSTAYGSSTTLDGALVTSHSQSLSSLSPSTTYHYRVKSRDAAGNLATSGDFTFTTPAPPPPGFAPNDTFDSAPLDPAKWLVGGSGSTVAVANAELEITHAPGAWTKGYVTSASPYDQTGRSVQVQMKRAANSGQGGSTYGETSIYLMRDSTHWISFFAAGGSLTAWSNSGSGEVNLTPAWPAYNSTSQQWLRFREASGRIYWETAAGTTAPGTWTTLASAADPFAMTGVQLQIVAGSNVNTTDVAKFDNVSTG